MNEYTEQFVKFKSIDNLNKWLRNYSNRISITYKNVINDDESYIYIIGFSSKKFGIEDYKNNLLDAINGAKKLDN